MVSQSSPFNSQKTTFIPDALTKLTVSNGKSRTNKWDPLPYTEQPAKQEALNCISLLDPWRVKLHETNKVKWRNRSIVFSVKQKDYEIARDPVKLANFYNDLISHHITMRVALFFLQAVACYKTPFHFEISNTDTQLLCAKNLKIKAKDNPTIIIKYQAAHPSTIPKLKACLIDDYKNALKKNKEPEYFSFLEDTYEDNLDNSTNSLPDFVNKIDTLIDCHAEGMRDIAIELLNELAEDNATPCEATRVFLHGLLDQLRECPKRSKKITEEKKSTLSIYKRKVKEMIILSNDTAKNSFFDQLLSINLSNDNDQDIPIIRDIVYKKKFDIICEAQCAEAKIHSILKRNFPLIKTPTKKHEIKLCLLYKIRKDPILKTPLQKLFAISIDAIKLDRNLCERLKLQYKAAHKKYDDALSSIREVIVHFQLIEQGFQAKLLKDFRKKLRDLSQFELSKTIKDIIKAEIEEEEAKPIPKIKKIKALKSLPTSESTISRLENFRFQSEKKFKTPENQRRKKLNVLQAEIISKALKIDPGHYFCSFFASAG